MPKRICKKCGYTEKWSRVDINKPPRYRIRKFWLDGDLYWLCKDCLENLKQWLTERINKC